ncbi:hypothetical protein B0T21DRAFT_181919 [Apiosordaria backusii]|uniref:Uncharacterized protein n=1 Tax=Apiosordaria backusii TaxID=314023 RepID=A0AA40EGA7_9PEZI|nr:hypothetical protein B0T21DRAFT_181919 [Apiosordaria backusii]
MEICEHGEIFVEEDADVIFDHTKIILRDADDEYFYAKINQRMTRFTIVDIKGLTLYALHVWLSEKQRTSKRCKRWAASLISLATYAVGMGRRESDLAYISS